MGHLCWFQTLCQKTKVRPKKNLEYVGVFVLVFLLEARWKLHWKVLR